VEAGSSSGGSWYWSKPIGFLLGVVAVSPLTLRPVAQPP
jgi:hypothetical protein